jgi:DNA-binding MarR family transcriptional regulator
MHPISYQLKRAHLCAVGVGRRIVNEVEAMTPARFDILFLLRKQMPRFAPRTALGTTRMRQREVQRLLGLSATTISKMFKRLGELGLVTRYRERYGDGRVNFVQLTALGLERIQQALGIVFTGRPLVTSYDALVRPRLPPRPRRTWKYRLLAELDELLHRVMNTARHHGDTSSIIYRLDYEPDH